MLSRHLTLSLVLLLVSAALAAADGVVAGKVALQKAASGAVANQRYQVVAKSGVLAIDPATAVVYLEGDFPKPATPARLQMPQKDINFVTPLLPVQTGTIVEFPNLDDTYHNIFSYSKPKRFDLGRYRSDERPIPFQTFDQPGLVALHCDIHEHMRGLILVLDTPHFSRTDSAGRYTLSGVPAGRYKLKAWLDSRTTLERAVEIRKNETLHVDFP